MASASAASSSSSKQQVVLWGPNYVKVYTTTTTTTDNNTEASTAGLQSDMEVDRPAYVLEEEERPPYVIVVHGPPKVGKSTLIRSLVGYYSKDNRYSVHEKGPIKIISGKKRRIQFVECPNSVSGMLDAAKYADAVMLLIDTYTSFEMETFEFVNILRVHGMPMVMGVLTSLDLCTNVDRLSRTKEYLKNHFTTEIHEGARIFCLSGLIDGLCKEHEILHLVNFLSSMEFYPLSRRDAQPYVLVDHFEDVTPPENMDKDNKCKRNIVLYGYLRGCDIKNGVQVHIAGVGDRPLFSVTSLADPCPLLASPKRKRSRKDKEHDASEGFKPGTYLRLEVQDVPFEMIQNYNPCHLILIGGISPGEETLGYIKATLTRHSWHKKLLRTRNPIIVSVGWRRYQTIPVYAVEDRDERLQMLHYTPVGT
ncbi:ribosome biogenesis protein bms1-like [Papaver somniferum]|uniref:ribosome biogenesis protein bms1-like n=1 Tax=Papaver somniferum TaxID=3469 RepID=UPI000E7035E6|nr:ribosome biogenesis protein bms1-like [Papaver somniferum]XP_026437729.1 ribosome biogenesis protein bms1-like [Papaver somniferum]